MELLPNELLLFLFSHLSSVDLLRLARVNKLCNLVALDSSLWYSLLHEDYLLLMKVISSDTTFHCIYHELAEPLKRKYPYQLYQLFTQLHRYASGINTGLKHDLIRDLQTLSPLLVEMTRLFRLSSIDQKKIIVGTGTPYQYERYILQYHFLLERSWFSPVKLALHQHFNRYILEISLPRLLSMHLLVYSFNRYDEKELSLVIDLIEILASCSDRPFSEVKNQAYQLVRSFKLDQFSWIS